MMDIESFSMEGCYCRNEDSFCVQQLESNYVIAVMADGMGGLSLGEMAANMVTKSVADFVAQNYYRNGEKDILLGALECADRTVRKLSLKYKSNMGAAVAVSIINDGQLFYTWQGNVRIYIIHDGELKLLTEDHIAQIGYGRTALTRCIKGSGLRDDIPYGCFSLSVGDSIFMCTDGLYKVAEDDLRLFSIDEIKIKLNNPEDDASIIRIGV